MSNREVEQRGVLDSRNHTSISSLCRTKRSGIQSSFQLRDLQYFECDACIFQHRLYILGNEYRIEV